MSDIIKPKSSGSRIVKDTVQYFFATITSQCMGILRSTMMPFLFIPSQMGVWNLMSVIIGYGSNAHLGILHGMNRIIPSLRGQQKFREIEVMKDSVFWVNLSLGVVAALGLFVASFFITKAYLVYLWLVAGIIFLQLIFAFQFSLFRANSSFSLVSRGIILFSICSTLFVVTFALLFHDPVLGALTGLAVAYLSIVFYWFVKPKLYFPLQIDPSSISQSLISGIPIYIIGLLDVVLMSIDRWVIAANLGITILGYYSLAIMVNNFIGGIPVSIANTLYPKMIERFALRQDSSESSNLLLGALRIGAMIMLILICAITFGLPLLIKFFLPNYLPSILIIKILVLGSFFCSFSSIVEFYLISINKQRLFMLIQVILIGLLIIFYIVALKLKYGIIGLTCITASGYFLAGLSYIFLAVYLVKGRQFFQAIRFTTCLIVPFVLMVICIIAANLVMTSEKAPILLIASSAFSFLFTISIVIPVAWFLNRDGDLKKLLQKELKLLKEAMLAKIFIGRKRDEL